MRAIVAVDENWAIGRGGDQLCYISADLKRFKELTMGHPVILGRKTLATFPGGRPLKGRRNLILSRDPGFQVEGGEVFRTAEALLAAAPDDAIVIGGGSVYEMLLPQCETVYVTRILEKFEADTWFPNLDADPAWAVAEEGPVLEEKGLRFQYVTYRRRTAGPEQLRGQIEAYVPRSPAEEADRRQMLAYLDLYPDTILLRENKAAHFSASAFILSEDGNWVLMARHDLYRVWAWAGGHADGEGDLLSVALREAREETGAEHIRPLSTHIASLEILPVWGHVKRGEYVPSHVHLNVTYLLTASRDDPLAPRPGENSEVAWLPADRLSELVGEWQMDEVYAKLLARGRELLGRQ